MDKKETAPRHCPFDGSKHGISGSGGSGDPIRTGGNVSSGRAEGYLTGAAGVIHFKFHL